MTPKTFRVTPGIVLVPLRLDHVGTTALFCGEKMTPKTLPSRAHSRVPAGNFDAGPLGSFLGVQNSPAGSVRVAKVAAVGDGGAMRVAR